MYCRNCGETIDENAAICIKCGVAIGKGVEYCYHCGAKVEKGQLACMSCGYAIPKEKTSIKHAIKNKKKSIIIASIVTSVAITLIILISVFVSAIIKAINAINFQKLFDEYCLHAWAYVGEDGSYLFIDTNPYNIEGEGLAYPDAYEAVKDINKALGLPLSLNIAIEQTSAYDGQQVRTYKDLGIEISWDYNPDSGLEIVYTKLEK